MATLRPRLEHLVRGYVEPSGAGESTADLVQEAALRIWQKLDQFRGADDAEQTAAVFLRGSVAAADRRSPAAQL